MGRWLGIDVHLHVTFLLLLAFIGLSHGLAAGNLDAALSGVPFFAGLFVCVLLHEYGHALAARSCARNSSPCGRINRWTRRWRKPAPRAG